MQWFYFEGFAICALGSFANHGTMESMHSPYDIEIMLTKVVFLMLYLDIWLVFTKISNGNFLFSKYFPKSIHLLMFVLDLPPGNEQTFLRKFSYPHI